MSDTYRNNKIILAPSILAGNHSNLEKSASTIEEAAVPWVHLDIMDGHFVPNLTFGPQTLTDLRKNCSLFFDTHLILDEPHRFIDAFVEAGADLISIHLEPDYSVTETLGRIRHLGCSNGVVLNPDTPADEALPFLEIVDLVLVMTVQPGFGGQSFRYDVLDKIETIDRWRQEKALLFRIEVDGGINLETARLCRDRGCDTFVAGTAFFQADNPGDFAANIACL